MVVRCHGPMAIWRRKGIGRWLSLSRFALMVPRDEPDAAVKPDIVEESLRVLIKLGHPEVEARTLLEDVLKTKKRFTTTEALIQAVYDFSRR